ncbi:MAG: hypothetical protein ACI9N9_002893 [Enterobacterales bacterium]|jgi:hypothetical protein
MKFNSSYEFFIYLIEQDADFYISGPDLNYPVYDIEIHHKLEVADKLLNTLYDFIINNMFSHFTNNSNIYPRIDDSGNLIFKTSCAYESLYDDPLQFSEDDEKKIDALLTPIEHDLKRMIENDDMFEISMNIVYQDGQFKEFDLNIVPYDDTPEHETEEELAIASDNIDSINLSYKKHLKKAIIEFSKNFFAYADDYSMSFGDKNFFFPCDRYEEFSMQWTESLSDEGNEELSQQLHDNKVYNID